MKKNYKDFPEVMVDIVGSCYVGSFVYKSLTMPLDETRVVKITLVDRPVSNKFTGISVSVIHKENGVLDTQYFPFKDYLVPVNGSVTVEGCSHIWKSGSTIEWYGMLPTEDSISELNQAIDDWISNWK